MASPFITVVLPVYNGERYLELAIQSVLAQTFEDFELLVVDDGSTDSTPSLLERYGSRLRVARQSNQGVGAAFNRGIREAAGEFISWLSHDDCFKPEKLQKQAEAVSQRQGPCACYTGLEFINEAGAVISAARLPSLPADQVLRHVAAGITLAYAPYSLMFHRSIVTGVGYYDESRKYTQDAEMLLRIARKFPIFGVEGNLMQVRLHPESGQRANLRRWQREAFCYFQSNLREIPMTEFFPELALVRPGDVAFADAYEWFGDQFMYHSYPIRWIAATAYRRALEIAPSRFPRMSFKIVKLGARYLLFRLRESFRFLAK